QYPRGRRHAGRPHAGRCPGLDRSPSDLAVSERQGWDHRLLLWRPPGVPGRLFPPWRRRRDRLLWRWCRRPTPGADPASAGRSDRAHQGSPVPVARIVRHRGRTPLAAGRRQDRGSAQEVRENLRVPHVRKRRARVLRRRPPAVSRARRGGRLEEGLRLVREAPPMIARPVMIERRPFGRTGHPSTVTLFGGAALARASQADADRTLDLLLRYGVNHIDTAARYGDSELRIGPWMARHRQDFFLATKTGSRTAPEASATGGTSRRCWASAGSGTSRSRSSSRSPAAPGPPTPGRIRRGTSLSRSRPTSTARSTGSWACPASSSTPPET